MRTIQIVNKEDLYSVPLPKRTSTYTPISHREIIELMEEEADKNNLTIQATNFQVAREGKQVIGYFDIKGDDEDMGIRTLFRNSYDKSMSAAVAIGTAIWCCSNGCISGEYSLKRIHKGVADDEIKYKIVEGFKAAGEIYESTRVDLSLMKKESLVETEVASIIGELFLLRNVLNTPQLNIVREELSNSKNFYHMEDDLFTMFDMYNHCTEALKQSHPFNYMKKHIDLHTYFREMMGYV